MVLSQLFLIISNALSLEFPRPRNDELVDKLVAIPSKPICPQMFEMLLAGGS